MAPVMQYVDEFPLEQLRLRIWQGSGEFTFYEDDGNSFEYKTGAFCTTNYRVYAEAEQTVVEIGARAGNWIPTSREIIVELVGKEEQRFIDDGTSRQLRFIGN
jgi:alpha-glucosidase